jgi:hypothetical protein
MRLDRYAGVLAGCGIGDACSAWHGDVEHRRRVVVRQVLHGGVQEVPRSAVEA